MTFLDIGERGRPLVKVCVKSSHSCSSASKALVPCNHHFPSLSAAEEFAAAAWNEKQVVLHVTLRAFAATNCLGRNERVGVLYLLHTYVCHSHCIKAMLCQ